MKAFKFVLALSVLMIALLACSGTSAPPVLKNESLVVGDIQQPPNAGSPKLPEWLNQHEPLARQKLIQNGENADNWFAKLNRNVNQSMRSANRPNGGGASGADALYLRAQVIFKVLSSRFVLIIMIDPCAGTVTDGEPSSTWQYLMLCNGGRIPYVPGQD